jgi:hypothetical protein
MSQPGILQAEMLKSLDIFIGLAGVMLVASMAVTVITQIYANLRNMRGKHLRDGLVDLLKQIDPALKAAIARDIAEAVLSHPLIRDSAGRLGTLVHRDEFTHLLIELAAGNGPQALKDEGRTALVRALQANGITDPAATLKSIRGFALDLEASHPELAAHVRRDLAILHGANSELVSKINGWFDQTIDRISGRFTLTTTRVSFVAAFVVAAAIQLDSIALMRRLVAGDAATPAQPHASWLGIALSTLLLSLGAPFWFEALKNLLRLRSVIAGKDDLQRQQRATTTADMPSAR